MAKIQNADKDLAKEHLFIAGRKDKWINHLGREFGSFSQS